MPRHKQNVLPVRFLVALLVLGGLVVAFLVPWLILNTMWADPTPSQSSCLTTLTHMMVSSAGAFVGLLTSKAVL